MPRSVQHAKSDGEAMVITLLPIMAAVFVAFLVTGLAMPVLLHVHRGLGLGTFVVGIVAGAQFGMALLTRFWSGHLADSRGAKRTVVIGLLMAAASGVLYLLSLSFVAQPTVSVTVLLVGRALFGGSESCVITGALSWGLVLGGRDNAGRVMSWVGTAMYFAFAVGAPAGLALYGAYGFVSLALATTLIPLLTLLVVVPQKAVAPIRTERPSIRRVVGSVWMPGLGLAFSSLGFGAITTFSVLLFAQHGWGGAWLAFTLFSGAFILGRLVFGHVPDVAGGAKVALFSVLAEAWGLALIWLAPTPALALFGAALTGLGYALVYPGFGVEAVRMAPMESRGLAMGAYTAFLDLALGLANPALGLVASRSGLQSVFLVSAIVVAGAAAIAFRIMRSARQNNDPLLVPPSAIRSGACTS